VINGVKGSRQVKKAETWYMLWADGIDEMIMNVEESSFSGVYRPPDQCTV